MRNDLGGTLKAEKCTEGYDGPISLQLKCPWNLFSTNVRYNL